MAQIQWDDEPGVPRIIWDPNAPNAPKARNPQTPLTLFDRVLVQALERGLLPDIPPAIVKGVRIGAPIAAGIGGAAVGGPLVGALAAGTTRAIGEGLGPGVLEAGGFLTGGVLGKGIGAGVKAATQTKAAQKFAEVSEKKLVELLQTKVPAWANLNTLTQMFQKIPLVSKMYDQSLKQAVKTGTGKSLTLRLEDAQKFSIPILSKSEGGPLAPGQMAQVDAGKAVEAITGQWKKNPGVYGRIAEALDQAGVGDPQAREAWRWAQGATDFLDKTGALAGEAYNPAKAMAGLTNKRTLSILQRRNMDEFAQAVRGLEPKPMIASGVQAETATGVLTGELGGAGVGSLLGSPLLGMIGGRHLGRMFTKPLQRFTGVPPLPVAARIQQVTQPIITGPLGVAGTRALETPAEEEK